MLYCGFAAEVAELADAPALGAGGRKAVGVRVPSSANQSFKNAGKARILNILLMIRTVERWTGSDNLGEKRATLVTLATVTG